MAKDIIPIEALTPVSKNDPRVQVSFDGQTLPRTPSTRHVRPRPFARQRVSLDRHGRSWTWCRAGQVEEGDVVADVGRIVETGTQVRYASAADVVPVHREHEDADGRPTPLIDVQFSPEDSRLLLDRFGSDKVAVGTDVVLTGAGGVVLACDEAQLVRAFRRS